MTELVFGYGSLAGRTGAPAELAGFRRWWGVAMDNSRLLPGYKCYLDESGARPHVYVAFLDLREADGGSVNGFLLEVSRAELGAFDDRERNYVRVDVSEYVRPAPGATVWAYFGTAAARARRRAAAETGRLVVSRAYAEHVEAGFAALGPDALGAFRRSTDPLPCAPAELRRVDLPRR